MTGRPEPGPWVERWLSAPRFAVYLSAAGSRRQALDLYEWNVSLAAAFHHDLAHLEVALRNAYDAAIVATTPPGLGHWTKDPYRLFPVRWRSARDGTRIDTNRTPREQLVRATREAGRDAPPGKIVAELTFGFWRYLSTAAHHDPLWIPHLHGAFVPGTSRRAVDRPVGRLHQFRNRIAHHEPLLRRDRATGKFADGVEDLRRRHRDLLTVARLISTEFHDYLAETSTVDQQLTTRPR